MDTRNPLLNDITRLFADAAGMAQAAGDEMKTLARSQADRIVAEMDLVRREEVDALRELARAALSRAEALEARVAELEARLAASKPGA